MTARPGSVLHDDAGARSVMSTKHVERRSGCRVRRSDGVTQCTTTATSSRPPQIESPCSSAHVSETLLR